jgi:hypothetical protein
MEYEASCVWCKGKMKETEDNITKSYKVRFREDQIEYDRSGKVVHSPLDYYGDNSTHGMLAFEGHDLAKSDLFVDLRVFYLEFSGTPYTDRQMWADPLRAQVISRLKYKDWNWYLSFVGSLPHRSILPDSILIENDFKVNIIQKERLNYTTIHSEARGGKISPRLIVEIPEHLITPVILRYWSNEWERYQIQGYLLPPGSITLLQEWDAKPRDDRLFREVIDQVRIAFHSYPTEHRHIVFLTNKLGYDEITEMIHLDDLKTQALEISTGIAQCKDTNV